MCLAFGTGELGVLWWLGGWVVGIRYRRGPTVVRNMRAVLKKASWGTRRIFGGIRCKKQASTVRKGHSVHENPLFLHGRRFLRHSVLKIGFYGTEEIFGTKNSLFWYATHLRKNPISLRKLNKKVNFLCFLRTMTYLCALKQYIVWESSNL